MTDNCKSRLTGDSADQKSTDERKRDAAFIGAGIAVFIIDLGLNVVKKSKFRYAHFTFLQLLTPSQTFYYLE